MECDSYNSISHGPLAIRPYRASLRGTVARRAVRIPHIATMVKTKRFKDLTGQTFTRWTVVRLVEKPGSATWLCRCICGVEKEVLSRSLVKGFSRSCGCLRAEVLLKASITHGASAGGEMMPEYKIYRSMRKRCLNPNEKAYPNYGGRGIKVCQRWLDSFSNFLTDMGKRPTPSHSLDRFPNNDGDYEPGNCRWATKQEQANNRRSSRYIEFQGVKRTVAEWGRITGIDQETIRMRLERGNSPEAALSTKPKQKKCKRHEQRSTPNINNQLPLL